MKYALYEAIDRRDNDLLLWLHDRTNHRVATFCRKTAPSRIKRRSIVAPETIVWAPEEHITQHADLSRGRHLGDWEV